MYALRIKPFLNILDVLVQMSVLMHSEDHKVYPELPDVNRDDLRGLIADVMPEMASADFDMCRKGAERLLAVIDRTNDSREIRISIDDTRRRILDQMDSVFCLATTRRERDLYEQKEPLFGDEVEKKFPTMSEDISEAGKCLALNRATASVFHLMRVMEVGVQRFGSVLGVQMAGEKNWQNILDEINKAIRALDQKAQLTKAYAAASAHLYNVKIASRNEVMHPKQTYSTEEAMKLFNATDAFIRDLANLI
jgi:hypothetical protein